MTPRSRLMYFSFIFRACRIMVHLQYCTAHDGWNTPPPRQQLFFFRQGLVICFWRMNNGWHGVLMSEQIAGNR